MNLIGALQRNHSEPDQDDFRKHNEDVVQDEEQNKHNINEDLIDIQATRAAINRQHLNTKLDNNFTFQMNPPQFDQIK